MSSLERGGQPKLKWYWAHGLLFEILGVEGPEGGVPYIHERNRGRYRFQWIAAT